MTSPGIMEMANFWGGSGAYIACFSWCKQTKGCIGVDVFQTKLQKKYNCALFSEICPEGLSEKSQFYSWEGAEVEGDADECTELSTEPEDDTTAPTTPSTPPTTTTAPPTTTTATTTITTTT